MRGVVMYAPGDVRVEERADPAIINPTDAIIRLAATCVCGSDLWRWRGTDPVTQPTPMGHEYAGIVEEVGPAVQNVNPGQFHPPRRIRLAAAAHVSASQPPEATAPEPRIVHPRRKENL